MNYLKITSISYFHSLITNVLLASLSAKTKCVSQELTAVVFTLSHNFGNITVLCRDEADMCVHYQGEMGSLNRGVKSLWAVSNEANG